MSALDPRGPMSGPAGVTRIDRGLYGAVGSVHGPARTGVDIKCVFVKYPYARQSEMGNMRLKNDAHTNYVRFSIYLFYR